MNFGTIALTLATLVSLTVAAPWVVLDTKSDMLAVSSEVSDVAITTTEKPMEGITTLPEHLVGTDEANSEKVDLVKNDDEQLEDATTMMSEPLVGTDEANSEKVDLVKNEEQLEDATSMPKHLVGTDEANSEKVDLVKNDDEPVTTTASVQKESTGETMLEDSPEPAANTEVPTVPELEVVVEEIVKEHIDVSNPAQPLPSSNSLDDDKKVNLDAVFSFAKRKIHDYIKNQKYI